MLGLVDLPTWCLVRSVIHVRLSDLSTKTWPAQSGVKHNPLSLTQTLYLSKNMYECVHTGVCLSWRVSTKEWRVTIDREREYLDTFMIGYGTRDSMQKYKNHDSETAKERW